MTPLERFMRQVKFDPNGCWYWRSKSGSSYGRTTLGGVDESAHCFAYKAFVGPIPEGLELDHRCHNADLTCRGGRSCVHRRCVNPAHLEPVSHGENIRRSPISMAAINARKTHCIRNHEFTPENTIRTNKGNRACRTCVNEAQARNRRLRIERQGVAA